MVVVTAIAVRAFTYAREVYVVSLNTLCIFYLRIYRLIGEVQSTWQKFESYRLLCDYYLLTYGLLKNSILKYRGEVSVERYRTRFLFPAQTNFYGESFVVRQTPKIFIYQAF